MGIKPTPRVRFKGTWDEKSNADRRRGKKLLESDKTKSNADRRRARRQGKKLLESDKTKSNADLRKAYLAKKKVNEMLKEMTGEGAKNISSINKSQAEEIMESYEKYMNRHDGGMAKKTRTF